MPKHTQSILQLDGRALERELERIIESDPIQKRPWTAKEIEILRRLHGKIPAKRLSAVLNRSICAVEDKAFKLGLTNAR